MNLEFIMTLLSTASFALIWYVQLISYPVFLHVGETHWQTYHKQHTRRITWIMAPLMLAQLAVSGLLALNHSWWDLVLVALVFILTFFWAVPLHNRLTFQFDQLLIQKLIRANFYRAIIWTFLWLLSLERML